MPLAYCPVKAWQKKLGSFETLAPVLSVTVTRTFPHLPDAPPSQLPLMLAELLPLMLNALLTVVHCQLAGA
jgi:hypothetical protein